MCALCTEINFLDVQWYLFLVYVTYHFLYFQNAKRQTVQTLSIKFIPIVLETICFQ